MRSKLCLAVVVLSLGLTLVACGDAVPEPAPAPTATPAEVDVQADCSQSQTDSVAQGIADKFGVSYDQVMVWACNGETYDDILLALQTAKESGRAVDELFGMFKKEGSWDKVWETLGLVSQ